MAFKRLNKTKNIVKKGIKIKRKNKFTKLIFYIHFSIVL